MDFGLFLPEFAVNEQDIVAGSPPYMAPEAIANITAAGKGALVDIYGLGVVGYEMLTGRLPREGVKLGSLKEVMQEVPAPSEFRDDIPAGLEALILEMLQTDPSARPSTAEEVQWRLKDVYRTDGDLAQKKKVLIVDDNREIARVLGYTVQRKIEECEVHYAYDGEEALVKLREHDPVLMLLDLEMPRLNGLEVVMYMRGVGLAERCAVVAVSAGAQESDRDALRSLGIHALVLKDEHMRSKLGQLLEEVIG